MRRTPRHLAVPSPRPQRVATATRQVTSAPRRDVEVGRGIARVLALGLASLALIVPAGIGSSTLAAIHEPAAGVPVAAPPSGYRAAAVRGPAGGMELPRPADPHRVPLPAAARPATPETARWVRPGVGILTSPFGMRWGKLHKGIDLGAPYGTPVYAASDGVVTFNSFKHGYNRYLTIDHGHGIVTAYAHMSATSVHVGQHVKAGQLIAREGSLGSGPHLHFEVYIGGSPVNPIPFLRKHGVSV